MDTHIEIYTIMLKPIPHNLLGKWYQCLIDRLVPFYRISHGQNYLCIWMSLDYVSPVDKTGYITHSTVVTGDEVVLYVVFGCRFSFQRFPECVRFLSKQKISLVIITVSLVMYFIINAIQKIHCMKSFSCCDHFVDILKLTGQFVL